MTTALIVAALVVSGCSGASVESSPSTSPNRAVPAQFIEEPPPELISAAGVEPSLVKPVIDAAKELSWTYYDVGGLTIAAACAGSGGPTVVYLNGLIVPAAWTWPLIAKEQAQSTRVCLFDRAGAGLSVRRPATAAQNGPEANAKEMFALLETMGEGGPYVLAGWSYGGIVARTAAAIAPDSVAGLALIDAVLPEQYRTFDTSGWTEADSDLDMARAEQILASAPKLGSKPVIVLQADHSDDGQLGGLEWAKGQRRAADLSTNSIYGVVRDSGHAVPQQHPRAVSAATTEIVASIRSGKPMPACPASLTAVGVDCKPLRQD